MWVDRVARVVQLLLGVAAFAVPFVQNHQHYVHRRQEAAKPVPLQGIWLIDDFSVSGEPAHALFTPLIAKQMHLGPQEDRWSKLIFERPGEMVIQIRNGVEDLVDIKLDASAHTAVLTDSGDASWKGTLILQQPGPGRLSLQGEVNGVAVSGKAHRLDPANFVLTNEKLTLVQ